MMCRYTAVAAQHCNALVGIKQLQCTPLQYDISTVRLALSETASVANRNKMKGDYDSHYCAAADGLYCMSYQYDAIVITTIQKQRSSKVQTFSKQQCLEYMYISFAKVGSAVDVIAPQQLLCVPLHWQTLHYLTFHRPVAQGHLAA
jgi:hypothetical protein